MKNMLRLSALLLFALVCQPASAGCLTLLFAGKCSASGPPPIVTPTILPLAGSYLNQNAPNGSATNVALRPNGGLDTGAVESLGFPSPTTNSHVIYVEGTVDTALGAGVSAGNGESLLSNNSGVSALVVTTNGPGLPAFFTQRVATQPWWTAASSNLISPGTAATAGTGYATGYYPFTATGGNCAREPAGVWTGGSVFVNITDPGFNCGTTPTVAALAIPADGAQQTTGASFASTCTANSPVTGQVKITASVAVAHGILPGQTFLLGTFPAPFATTYTALPGTSGTTLIGTAPINGGSCTMPVNFTGEGTALGGTGATLTLTAVSTTAPYAVGATGVTTQNGQRFCGIVGEYGSEVGSNFPGAQFASFVDTNGNPLPNAPALVPNLNQGTANFTGTVTNGSAVLTVSAMPTTTITGASYVAASGSVLAKASFTVSAAPRFMPGSEFTVSGMTPSGYNGTYVADGATTQASTTIVGIPMTGPLGTPAVLASLGAGTGFGSFVSVLMPGMVVQGTTPSAQIGPFATGQRGGVGSYTLTASQTGAGTVSVSFAFPAHYYTASGTTISLKSQTTLGDFWSTIGSSALTQTHVSGSWGGSIANLAMLWGGGGFPGATAASDPTETLGAPSISALASLCKKTTDIQSFAAANGLTVHSLNHMNPSEGWADSSLWTGTGDISGASGSTATFNADSTLYGSAPTTGTIAGPGIPGCPLACPTLSGTTLTWASAIAGNVAVGPMTAGTFKPALPLSNNLVNGYIDNGGGSTPTLHVTGLPTATSNPRFTGTLGNTLTGTQAGTTLTVTATSGVSTTNKYASLGIGTTITVPGGTNETIVAPLTVVGSASGGTGTYQVSVSQTIATATNMFANGVLPGPATSLMVSGVTGSIAAAMIVTDGGANITNQPLLVQGAGLSVGSNATWILQPTYNPLFTNDTTLQGTLVGLTPGQYIQTTTTPGVGVPTITTPVRITGYAAGFVPTVYPQALLLSNAASNGVGSAGSPVPINGTGIGDAGAIAPGPALTISDLGPGVTFPATATCTAFASCTGSGTIKVSGTFDTAVLGGTPAPAVQGSISLTSGGAPISGCSACAWTNLTGYSATLVSGTVWNWSGTLVNIPPSPAPVCVSVRAANGTAYATMPSLIKVGVPVAQEGEGEVGAFFGNQSGTVYSYFQGLWGANNWFGNNNQAAYYTGPPVAPSRFLPASTIPVAGDRFGLSLGCSTCSFSETSNTYEQELSNALGGWPVTLVNTNRDAIGSNPKTFGENPQTQTIGSGDGTTLSWCSVGTYCGATSSPVGVVSGAGPLYFNAASMTGATLANATISGTALTVPLGNQTSSTVNTNGLVSGALEPGMVLGLKGSPTLDHCLTGCTFLANAKNPGTIFNPAQTWALNCTGACPATVSPMRVEPASGPAVWSAYNLQAPAGMLSQQGLAFATGLTSTFIQAGSFQVTVNGTVVCQDSAAFAWNVLAGNCTGTNVAASSFVDYLTGDYQITFTSGHAPASGATILATWTNIMSPSASTGSLLTSRPIGIDFFGNGTPQSGPMSSMMAQSPGGLALHIDGGDIADDGIFASSYYAVGAPALTQLRTWYFGTRFGTIPGSNASTPVMSVQTWRGEGVVDFGPNGGARPANLFGQWGIDFATKSTFLGSISGTTLTLSAAAGGPMWEGEVIDCATSSGCPLTPTTGVYITGLLTGSWGASGSTYSVVNPGSLTVTSGAMENAAYYKGTGPAYFSGPINDVAVQGSTTLAAGYAPHMTNGPFGGRRVGQRWAAQDWAAVAGDPTLASDASLSRASGSTACPSGPSPCFDYTTTYATTATPTAVSGATLTFNGLTAHTIPIRVGANVTCTGCTSSTFVVSVGNPPTQDTRAGQGQIGSLNNGFTVTLNQAPGASGVPFHFGCTPGSGGSNCVNFVFQAGTTKGTFTAPFALATCGENNLSGSAPVGAVPMGVCQSNGIGSLVRTFRIGTAQSMWAGTSAGSVAGSPYDDGADPGIITGPYNQGGAFTCNIVDTVVVQCMKGAAYDLSLHTLTGIGKWTSGSTFTEYGDAALGTSRLQAIIGYVGGQPFPFVAGSGATASTSTIVQDATCAIGSGGVRPKLDITTVNGGGIVNVYPSSTTVTQAMGDAIGAGCTFATPGTAGSGTVTPPVYNPVDGVGGIATYNTDSNMMGDMLYGNEGAVGNPLNGFFPDGYVPGLPVIPFGNFLGVGVSG